MNLSKGVSPKQYRRRLWHRQRRDNFRALGLTHDGKQRQRGPWTRYPKLDHLSPRARVVARVQLWRERTRYANGFSERGKPQGNKGGRPPQLSTAQYAWKEFRTTGNVPTGVVA